ncbi:MAG: hypothetical protein HC767_09390 [Akkermansiaceae bacterium]|nr:hypothetical protein [Akkermansiaceae bacterium]
MFENFSDGDVVEAWFSQPNAGLDNRTQFVFGGKTLGGNSAINGAVFSRPEAKVRGLGRLLAYCCDECDDA